MVASAIANKVSVQCSELIRGHSNSAHAGLGEGGVIKMRAWGRGPHSAVFKFGGLLHLLDINLTKQDLNTSI